MGWLMMLLRRLKLDRLFFALMYRQGQPPWDTGISPPELVETVEGAHALPPGRALDLGCGTGTNSLYLARHGWHTVGVDFVASAIARARVKARAAEPLPGTIQLYRGDVTRLEDLRLGDSFTLLLDLGCFHGLPVESRERYVAGVTRAAAPGALFLLYAFGPRTIGIRKLGLTEAEIRALFGGAFTVERVEVGSDRVKVGSERQGITSAWYWLRRLG